MTGLPVSAFGVALTGMGVFMYKSPRAIEVIRRHPFSKWKWWWKLSELWVLGAVPEGLGLMLAGVAQFMHADVVSLSLCLRQLPSCWAYGLGALIGLSRTGCDECEIVGGKSRAQLGRGPNAYLATVLELFWLIIGTTRSAVRRRNDHIRAILGPVTGARRRTGQTRPADDVGGAGQP
jgi:hypothetical protein